MSPAKILFGIFLLTNATIVGMIMVAASNYPYVVPGVEDFFFQILLPLNFLLGLCAFAGSYKMMLPKIGTLILVAASVVIADLFILKSQNDWAGLYTILSVAYVVAFVVMQLLVTTVVRFANKRTSGASA